MYILSECDEIHKMARGMHKTPLPLSSTMSVANQQQVAYLPQ